MVKVLHIANDYAGSKVYKNLIMELDKLGVEQVVYTPVRGEGPVGKNSVDFARGGSRIIYSSLLNWHVDRLIYPYKIFKIFRDIQRRVDFSSIDLIHAHTWYSDGGVAYFLAKKYRVPFIVAIRSTDLNVFYKKLAYVRTFGKRVLEESRRVILISASLKSNLSQIGSLRKSLEHFEGKIGIIPNGVDSYWLCNSVAKGLWQPKDSKVVNIIYVGTFIKRKRLVEIQRAVIDLNLKSNNCKVHLHIVGGGGGKAVEAVRLIGLYPDYFTYHGKIDNKDELARLYRSSDIFVMPSLNETFGLVYVEAMSQGLPILYTENDGIDGFYSESIGEKVKRPTVQEIAEKLSLMIGSLDSYSIPIEEIKRNHSWAEIAKRYISIYKESL